MPESILMAFESVLLTTYDCPVCGTVTSAGSAVAWAPPGAVEGDRVPCMHKGCSGIATLTRLIRNDVPDGGTDSARWRFLP
jgi:hypothetical protein